MKNLKFNNKSGKNVDISISKTNKLKPYIIGILNDESKLFLNDNFSKDGTAHLHVLDTDTKEILWKGYITLDRDITYNGKDVFNESESQPFKSLLKTESSGSYILYLIVLIILLIAMYMYLKK